MNDQFVIDKAVRTIGTCPDLIKLAVELLKDRPLVLKQIATYVVLRSFVNKNPVCLDFYNGLVFGLLLHKYEDEARLEEMAKL